MLEIRVPVAFSKNNLAFLYDSNRHTGDALLRHLRLDVFVDPGRRSVLSEAGDTKQNNDDGNQQAKTLSEHGSLQVQMFE